jgi:cysteine desulfurase/selenocysteine lyase
MADHADAFGPFDDHVWLNCAHQGPLPKVAVEAGRVALEQKRAPFRLPYEAFDEVPARLKRALGSLLGCPADEMILGNSTSYGLNLLVQGLPLEEGDEVLLVDGDFPATVMTWLPLRKRGIDVRLLKPASWPPTADEIAAAFTDRTRVFCSSWVFSFYGAAIDIARVGRVCRGHDVLFVLNGAQAFGARPFDIDDVAVDAVVGCGFKWLCGPYGTGFAWIRPELRERLRYEQAYWLSHASPRAPSYELQEQLGAERYDVFGTANFLNFMTWTAAIELLLQIGIDSIAAHDDALVERTIDGLDKTGYRLIGPRSTPDRSTLVLFQHNEETRTAQIYERLQKERIHVAERDGKLRISPHLYNTRSDIDRALDVLAKLA